MTEALNETTSGPAGYQPVGLKPWQLKRGAFTRVVSEIIDAGERAKAATPLGPLESSVHDSSVKERDELESKLKGWQAAERKSQARWDECGKAMVALVQEKYPQWVEEGVVRIMPDPRRGEPHLAIARYDAAMREAIVLGRPVPLDICQELCSEGESDKYMQNVQRIRLEREFARANLAAILRAHHVNDLAQLGENLKEADDGAYIVRVHLRDDTSLNALDPALKDPSKLEKISAIGLSYAGESRWQWISLGKYAATKLAVESFNEALVTVTPERAYEMEQ